MAIVDPDKECEVSEFLENLVDEVMDERKDPNDFTDDPVVEAVSECGAY